MTTQPGQGPRPAFTPRGNQARPGTRGAGSGWPGDANRHDEARRPRDSSDYRAGGRDVNGAGDRGWHDRPDWAGADARDRRGGRDTGNGNGQRPDGPRRPAPSFTPGGSGAPGGAGAPGRPRPDRGMAERAARAGQPSRTGLLAIPGLRWLGTLSTGRAIALFTVVVLLGMMATIVMGQEPGFLLGSSLVIGSVAAAATVRRGRSYAFIPLPALAYLITSTLAGIAHDSSALTSSKEYLVNFLVWIGGSFVAVTASTVLVVLIALVRWLLGLRLVSGQLPATGRAGAGRAASWPPDASPRDNGDSRDAGPRRSSRAWTANSGPWRRPDRPYDSWGSQGSQGAREDRDPRAQRPPARPPRDPRDSRGPYDDRDRYDDRNSYDDRDRYEDRNSYDDRDRYDRDRRPPAPPRDLW